MKKRIAALLMAALMALSWAAALAEEDDIDIQPVPMEDVIGVWSREDDPDGLTMTVLPGSYAPIGENEEPPQLYAEVHWPEEEYYFIRYRLFLDRVTEHQSVSLGSSLLNAVGSLFSQPDEDDDVDAYPYKKGSVDIVFPGQSREERYVFPFNENPGGIVIPIKFDDGPVMLYWEDDYDPHASGLQLFKLTVTAPDAQAVSANLFAPVIDMEADAQAQTALQLVRYAVNRKLCQADPKALSAAVQDAWGNLSRDEQLTFVDRWSVIAPIIHRALGLTAADQAAENRFAPFETAGLKSDAEALMDDALADKYSATLMYDAIAALMK